MNYYLSNSAALSGFEVLIIRIASSSLILTIVLVQASVISAVLNKNGDVLAHSDPAKIGKPFRKTGKLVHLGPAQTENNELVDTSDKDQVFEVHRYFQPLEKQQISYMDFSSN